MRAHYVLPLLLLLSGAGVSVAEVLIKGNDKPDEARAVLALSTASTPQGDDGEARQTTQPRLLPPVDPAPTTSDARRPSADNPFRPAPKRLPRRSSQEGKKSTPGPSSTEKEENDEEATPEEIEETFKLLQKLPWYTAHAQSTVVGQGHGPFHSPYVGPNSLLPGTEMKLTATATLYLAARLWQGGSIVFNPEMAAGSGVSGTLGLAGFPNGEATRVGQPQPTPYFARFELQQVFELGGEWEMLQDAPNQLPGPQYKNNVIFKLGKMTATDDFDDNRYSHDPRTQFLNWALMYNGAWDYPANARGYTYGGTVEMNLLDWSWRYGLFAEPAFANGAPFDPHILRANGHSLEFEQRYRILGDHLGAIRVMSWLNNAHMGNYRVALRDMPIAPDITKTRAYRVKYGFGVSWEQEITRDLGLFGRLGWDDGHTEAWAFTEIDATASFGMSLKGREWGRKYDTIGVAGVINGLSNGHRDYLAAGGIGFIVGDGKLHYGAEMIAEAYYNLQLRRNIYATLDFQGVENPAYNRDRGPVLLTALRVHLEY